jgi:ribonuclease HII
MIGVDEAGRGPLAGPVVAAAVLLCPQGIAGLDDSKKLSAKQRAELEAEIKAKCRWAVGIVEVEDIARLNIFGATMRAMTLAVATLLGEEDAEGPILIDGNMTPAGRDAEWRWHARAIVGGDAVEPCISAASIIAKQARDAMMVEACARYPGYGFSRHKGYGTAEHLAALKQLGPCPLHRQDFAPVRQLMLL